MYIHTLVIGIEDALDIAESKEGPIQDRFQFQNPNPKTVHGSLTKQNEMYD